MVDKIWAEGSIWNIPEGDLPEEVMAELAVATSVKRVTSEVWKMYYPPGMTPTVDEMARRIDMMAHPLMLVAPVTPVKVTPMWEIPVTIPENDLTLQENSETIEIQQSKGENA